MTTQAAPAFSHASSACLAKACSAAVAVWAQRRSHLPLPPAAALACKEEAGRATTSLDAAMHGMRLSAPGVECNAHDERSVVWAWQPGTPCGHTPGLPQLTAAVQGVQLDHPHGSQQLHDAAVLQPAYTNTRGSAQLGGKAQASPSSSSPALSTQPEPLVGWAMDWHSRQLCPRSFPAVCSPWCSP